jgi:hypothetical protein
MSETLRNRIAEALGWSIEDTKTFDLATLRELVRPVSQKLAYEITEIIRKGEHLT